MMMMILSMVMFNILIFMITMMKYCSDAACDCDGIDDGGDDDYNLYNYHAADENASTDQWW